MIAQVHNRVLPTEVLAADSGSAARAYAAAGLPVIPLHTPDAAGRCDCGCNCGSSAGKHGRTAHGHRDATTARDQVHDWWNRNPIANLGLATGQVSGLVVLDIDPRHGGEATMAQLEAEHGTLAPTWAVETGGGGLHLYYQHPGGRIPNSAGRLGPGLDIRGDGGFIVAPPSRHYSGAKYRWAAGWDPTRTRLADLPPG